MMGWMETENEKTIGELLKRLHLERSREAGHVITQREFAAWFGIDPISFNKYYNDGRVPDGENLERIAAKAGPVAYKLAGRVPQDIQDQVSLIPPDKLAELKDLIEDYLIQNGYKRKE